MRRRLRRFVAVGTVVTAVHLATLVVAVFALELPVPVAAAAAVLVAATLSFVGHRHLTFADDPFASVDHRLSTFAAAVAPAAVVDVAIVTLYTLGPGDLTPWRLIGAELVALTAAAAVRLVTYRRVLFAAVRAGQAANPCRPPLAGPIEVSVVVPVVDDAERIATNLTRLRTELGPLVGPLEIVVVDDGSSDGTAAAAAGGADVVVRHETNRGKGAAVRTGMLSARGRNVVFTDADLAYPPAQLARLVRALDDGADVVVGNRRHPSTDLRRRPPRVRELGSVVFNLFTHLVLLGQYRDTQCGLKGMRRDVARLVFSRSTVDGFAFDVEVLHLVERDRLSLVEVPVVLEDHEVSTISVVPVALDMVAEVLRVRRQGSHGRYDLDVDLPAALARADAAFGPSPRTTEVAQGTTRTERWSGADG